MTILRDGKRPINLDTSNMTFESVGKTILSFSEKRDGLGIVIQLTQTEVFELGREFGQGQEGRGLNTLINEAMKKECGGDVSLAYAFEYNSRKRLFRRILTRRLQSHTK